MWVFSLLIFLVSFTKAQDELYKDPTLDVEDRIDDLLPRMTLMEKIGQMIMDIENTPENAPGVGGYMVGAAGLGNENLGTLMESTPENWRQRNNALQAASANNRLGIPVLIAGDAVHGQNILSGATIFPHNIGLGATRNPSLIRQVGRVTAEECISSSMDMAFSPTLAVAQTITWGRTYESYSEDTDTVRMLTADFIEGLQGASMPLNMSACAKHWIGDGATVNGTDAGDVTITEEELMEKHGTPYIDAIAAGVQSIMISFSSINGTQMHNNPYWITNILKDTMGFDGFVLSDWEAYTRNPGDYDSQVRLAINAGLDMLLAPYQSWQIFETVTMSIEQGLITQERIDDAVRRVLRAKFRMGLFEKKIAPLNVNVYEPVGTAEHRAIARQAVRESLVLLKNENNLLPLTKTDRIFLAGKSADNIQNQCGGWTMSWQGTSDSDRHAIVGGTTIRDGFESLATNTVTFNEAGVGADPLQHDVAIVVVGETPYAEFEGDREDLSLDSVDQTAIATVKASGVPIILVIVSGRPIIITDEIEGIDAVVAAWLPGTEGDGIAEVFFGDEEFSGKLSFSWPASMDQITNGFVGDNPNVLFPFGFGLEYGDVAPTADITPAPIIETEDESVAPTSEPTEAPSPEPTATAMAPATTPQPSTSEPSTSEPEATPQPSTLSPTTEATPSPTRAPLDVSNLPQEFLNGTSGTIGAPTRILAFCCTLFLLFELS